MDDLKLLIDLHITADRQGPGDATQTRRAIELAGLSKLRKLNVADIGCGTGASAMVLAQDLESQVVAVDSLPEFLATLRSRAEQAGLGDRITTVDASMDRLPFEAESLDAIWSEGAIYNMGFETERFTHGHPTKRGAAATLPLAVRASGCSLPQAPPVLQRPGDRSNQLSGPRSWVMRLTASASAGKSCSTTSQTAPRSTPR